MAGKSKRKKSSGKGKTSRGTRRSSKNDSSSLVINFLLLLMVILSVSLGVLYRKYLMLSHQRALGFHGISEYAPWEKSLKSKIFSKDRVRGEKNSRTGTALPENGLRRKTFIEHLSPFQRGRSQGSRGSKQSVRKHESYAYLAIVLDDFGNENRLAMRFFKIDYPLTCAVLPRLRYSRWASETAASFNKEVILHQPVEPYGYPKTDPGPGVITTDMGRDEVFAVLEENLKSVPQAIGMNNHMGSKGTEDYFLMSSLMEFLKQKNMFFLDSRTSPDTLACSVAKDFGVPCVSRDVFLDNKNDIRYVEAQLMEAVSRAKSRGYAVAIGHATRTATARVLKSFSKRWRRLSIKPVPISFIVMMVSSKKLSFRMLFGRFMLWG